MISAYETDPYARSLDTEITAIGEERDRLFATLADTILYPEGGGQPGDRGTLGQTPVIDVQRVGGDIRHFLRDQLEPGPTTLRLDWQRRYDHMQQHTAQHVLSAIAADRHHWQTTSFHLGDQVSDIELAVPDLGTDDINLLEEEAAEEIRKASPVLARRVPLAEYRELDVRSRGLPQDHTGDVRLVEIEGLDLNTCGGTHVANTAEIETLKLLGADSMRGGTRLYWVAGKRVRSRLRDHEARHGQLRTLLETSDDDLVSLAELKLHQLRAALRQTRTLSSRLAQLEGVALAGLDRPVVHALFEDAEAAFLQEVARSYLEGHSRSRMAFLTASRGEAGFFLLAAADSTIDLQPLGALVAELLEGRGGGSGPLFQGRAGSLRQTDRVVELLVERLSA